ncbi:hypothetical protein BT69DRAFT_377536 [Atractiella rhizophila]|nr:hypothetical protein BT69DRAFT_377536 [Atractiella rhizophila]
MSDAVVYEGGPLDVFLNESGIQETTACEPSTVPTPLARRRSSSASSTSSMVSASSQPPVTGPTEGSTSRSHGVADASTSKRDEEEQAMNPVSRLLAYLSPPQTTITSLLSSSPFLSSKPPPFSYNTSSSTTLTSGSSLAHTLHIHLSTLFPFLPLLLLAPIPLPHRFNVRDLLKTLLLVPFSLSFLKGLRGKGRNGAVRELELLVRRWTAFDRTVQVILRKMGEVESLKSGRSIPNRLPPVSRLETSNLTRADTTGVPNHSSQELRKKLHQSLSASTIACEATTQSLESCLREEEVAGLKEPG